MPNIIRDFIKSYSRNKLKQALINELSKRQLSAPELKDDSISVKSWIKAIRKAAIFKKLAAENIKKPKPPKQPKLKKNKLPKAPRQPKIKKAEYVMIREKLAMDVSTAAKLKRGLGLGGGLLGAAAILSQILRRTDRPNALRPDMSETMPSQLTPEEQLMKDYNTLGEVKNAVREFDWMHSPPGRNLRYD